MSAMLASPGVVRPERPRWRGLLHQYAFLASLIAVPALLVTAANRRAAFAAAIYGGSLSALFGVSALYHRVTWSVRARRWMGRLDHAMIGFLIAGTFTPIGMLVLRGTVAGVSLATVWAGAVAGMLLHGLWIDAPKWLSAVLYVALGWTGLVALPDLVARLGWPGTAILALGGLLYSAGAAVYALRRPDPLPAVFGYHEVFHALVTAGAVSHYAVVAVWVLPAAA
jgi:hemolysin III